MTTINLHNRDFLKELDFTADELIYLIELARSLKAAKKNRTERQLLTGRNIALVFEKTSTRTRCAFEVGAYDQGAHVTYLDPSGSQMGHKESVADTARVLSRYYDAIEYRGSRQAIVEELAEYASVPVYNGLTDEWHPTQMLADFMTMLEHSGKPAGEIRYAFMGDGRFNMGRSLLITGAILGADVRIVAPRALWPNQELQDQARAIAARSGARVTLTDNVAAGLNGVDFVHTDVWVSMGEDKQVWDERIRLLLPYQVNPQALAMTGNPNVKFMHCLPAFHDDKTSLGREIFAKTGLKGLEVTDDVFDSPMNVAFDQAENRLHTIKALLVATLADPDDLAAGVHVASGHRPNGAGR
ncbi:MAG: ornithine carbamoyltransferase [Anaerolineae bacterium]|nr:ornithine carbamoyltransferase [Anaerolineae bacterium]